MSGARVLGGRAAGSVRTMWKGLLCRRVLGQSPWGTVFLADRETRTLAGVLPKDFRRPVTAENEIKCEFTDVVACVPSRKDFCPWLSVLHVLSGFVRSFRGTQKEPRECQLRGDSSTGIPVSPALGGDARVARRPASASPPSETRPACCSAWARTPSVVTEKASA